MINHLKTIEDVEFNSTHSDKHHVLFLGKSGSGKTLIANTVAEYFELPFAVGDATNYSPTGFQGADADSVVYDLLLNTGMNFELAEKGIVFMDEIDKICSSNQKSGRYESFIGSTQSTLLKLVEGKVVKIPGPVFGEPPGAIANLDTSKMLFIFGGAFNGLAEIIAKSKGLTEKTMGFRTAENNKMDELDEAMKSYEIFSNTTREEMVNALIEFGMLAELIGRIGTVVPFKPLTENELQKVLTDSNVSPVQKQQELFARSGYELVFTDDFIAKVVEKAYKSATGTRALDSYVKHSVGQASFDCLNLHKHSMVKDQIIISAATLENPENYQKCKIYPTGSLFGSFSTSTAATI